jgi:hypothetical protein
VVPAIGLRHGHAAYNLGPGVSSSSSSADGSGAMADVFISYASPDRERARKLAEALIGLGFTVFWDRSILPGQKFDEVIETQLDGAGCVVALWSKASVSSDWVKTEAAEAAGRRVLIPALIESVKPPLEFRRLQTADLVDWKGQAAHSGFATLLAGVAAKLGRPSTGQTMPPPAAPEEPAAGIDSVQSGEGQARRAYAAYAAQDRLRVLDRVAALSLSGNLDVFMDGLSLHPGEEWKQRLEREIASRELFLLFWSSHARRSKWVEWEWRTALRTKGLSGIQVQPLEPVDQAPPPPELSALHFGDVYALARNAYERRGRVE